jgi:3-phenylpropionate/cinnamic acid dioxygenase small subunit
MVYWVPKGSGDYDPEDKTSIIYDHRLRLATRIWQLKTGVRHAQTPPSSARRIISNIEMEKLSEDTYRADSNFIMMEVQLYANHSTNIWCGQLEHRLRRRDGGLKMFLKKINLVNSTEPLPTLAFII